MGVLKSLAVLVVAVFSFNLMSEGLGSTEYIIKMKSGLRAMNRVNLFSSSDAGSIKESHAEGNLLRVEINNNESGKYNLEYLRERPDVEYVVENIEFRMFEKTNDTELSKQWALEKINAYDAWDKSIGSKKVIIAVIDTGVDVTHPDLAGNIWKNEDEIAGNGKDDDNNGYVDDVHGWDFHGKDNDPTDETSFMNPGHGTHCAGVIGAIGNNNIGISGINQQVSIMPLRFLGANGGGDLFASTKAIDYAVANGAQVISASWGAKVPRSQAQPIIDAIERAQKAGVLFVVAAANNSENNDSVEVYPSNAGLPNVISVGASDHNDKKAGFSNYGVAKVDIAAPGTKIYSTIPNNKYKNLDGTSMATPYVAGLAGLLLSREESENLTPAEIKAILLTSGAEVDISVACKCRIDASEALGRVIDKKLTVVPAAASLAPEAELQFAAVGGDGEYKFSSSDESVATISDEGLLTAVKDGEVVLTVLDGSGNEAQSLAIHVGAVAAPPEGGNCPLGNPFLCMLSCLFAPDLPWCSGGGAPGDGGEEGGNKNPFPFPIPGM